MAGTLIDQPNEHEPKIPRVHNKWRGWNWEANWDHQVDKFNHLFKLRVEN